MKTFKYKEDYALDVETYLSENGRVCIEQKQYSEDIPGLIELTQEQMDRLCKAWMEYRKDDGIL